MEIVNDGIEDADNDIDIDDECEDAEEPKPSLLVRGRYNLPHPITGKPAKWTRATRFIEPLEDKEFINKWEKRKAIEGIARRKDLYAEAVTLLDDDDTWKMDKLVEKCKDAAGSNLGSRMGSMFHKLLDRHDMGQPTYAPAEYEHRIAEYAREIKAHGLMVVTELIERTVINLEYDCAGTFDKGFNSYDGNLYMGDTKSQEIMYGYLGKAAQISLYVNAHCMWDPKKLSYVDMPKFNKEIGYIIWIPAKGEGCQIHWVDLKEGLAALDTALDIKGLRSAGRRKNVMGGYTGRPSRLTLVSAYAARIKDAEMLADVERIKQEAQQLGVWGRELETYALARIPNLT